MISGKPNFASELAIIKSLERASSKPPPKAYPSTNEIIGISIFCKSSILEKSFCFFAFFESSFSSSLISAPGEKNFEPPIKPIHLISFKFVQDFWLHRQFH